MYILLTITRFGHCDYISTVPCVLFVSWSPKVVPMTSLIVLDTILM